MPYLIILKAVVKIKVTEWKDDILLEGIIVCTEYIALEVFLMFYPLGSKQLRQFSMELMLFCALCFQYKVLKALQSHHLCAFFFPEGLELIYCIHFYAIVSFNIPIWIFSLAKSSSGTSNALISLKKERTEDSSCC